MKRVSLAVLPYVVFSLLLVVSWNRWIEPYVDSGRELMVPWRLAHGEALYRDVRFYHGPLAPFLAAGIDALLGRSLAARIVFAAAIALAHLEALRRLAQRLLAPARACLAASGIVAVAFFLRPGGQLFPFSFDTSLAVAAIAWALHLAAGRPGGEHDRAAGACLAAALLCRPEMGIAAVLLLGWEARVWRRLLPLAALPLLGAGIAYTLLSVGTPLETLRREGWLAIIGPPEAFRNVYAAFAGFDRPALRLAELALAAIVLVLVAALLVTASFLARAVASVRRASVRIEVGAILLLGAASAAVLWPPESLAQPIALLPPLVRIVPLIALGAALARLAHRVTRFDRDLSPGVPDAVLFVAGLFAVRLFLAAGYVGPYNAFLLPLPLLVTAAVLFSVADRARASAGEALGRLVSGALVLFFLFRIAALTSFYRQGTWSRVDTRAGSVFLTEPVAMATRGALDDLARRVPSGGSLVGFPEAGFFDYVLGLRSTLPQEQFFPGHLSARLEQQTIATLSARPPDAVLLCNVLAVGHGSRSFGRDYLVALGHFLRENFVAVASYGPGAGPDARIGDPQFFVTVRVPGRGQALTQ